MTLAESVSGEILPMQLIYKGKTHRSLPPTKFSAGFLLNYNESHWSNEKDIVNLVKDILNPYLRDTKERLGLDESQISLLIWDAFSGQKTELVKSTLAIGHIKDEPVPSNLTHLLQPLDLTTNAATKKIEKRAFSEYFTERITTEMLNDPNMDLMLSTLKPKLGKVMCELYHYVKSNKGKDIIMAGWRAAGILDAVEKGRRGQLPNLDPYV